MLMTGWPGGLTERLTRFMPLKSMRSQLIASVVTVLVVAFLGINFLNYHLASNTLKQGVVERELPLTGDTIYSEIQADLVRPTLVSSQMSNNTFLRDWALNGEEDPEQVRRFLDEIRTKYGFFTAFFISEKTHRYYHFTGVSKTIDEQDPHDVWYFRVRGMAEDYEISVDPNQQQDNRITVFINFKVRDYAGNFIGVTGVGLELDALAKIVDRYRGDFRRNVYFVERSGRITLHPDSSVAYRRHLADMPGMAEIAAEVADSNRGTFEYGAGDKAVLLTTRYIPELQWVLLVEQRETTATAAASHGLKMNILIGVAAILLTGLIIGWIINRFQRRLEFMATTDSLTGLHNRQVFDIALTQAVERAIRSKSKLALILIDIDRFKAANDRFGHMVGDRVLQQAALLLRGSVRKADVLARWGGEEFTVLMENCGEAEAVKAAEELRRRIAEDLRIKDIPEIHMTASFGVASFQLGEDSAAPLLLRADKALYRAKELGRNRVAGFAGIADRGGR